MLILMEATGQVCVDCERPFDDGEMARMCRHTGGFACDDREACERRVEALRKAIESARSAIRVQRCNVQIDVRVGRTGSAP